jgi:hypothetical protein
MATYKSIILRARELGARGIKTCHVAHVKADYGLTTRLAVNRHDLDSRTNPCPPHIRAYIEQAMRDLGVFKSN